MKIKRASIVMTEEEKVIFKRCRTMLEEIADSMDRAVSVDYCSYDDDEINFAIDVIDDILDHTT